MCDLSLFDDDRLGSVFLLAGGRNSMTLPGQDGPAPMAIFELLDYIVVEVCFFRSIAAPSLPPLYIQPYIFVYDLCHVESFMDIL